MPKPKTQDIDEELKKQEDEFYGEGTASGSAPDPASDDDVTAVLDATVGLEEEEEEEEPEPFSLAEEVKKDEKARWQKESPEEMVDKDL